MRLTHSYWSIWKLWNAKISALFKVLRAPWSMSLVPTFCSQWQSPWFGIRNSKRPHVTSALARQGKTPWCTALPCVQQEARHTKQSKTGMINTRQEGPHPRGICDTSPKASTKAKAKQGAGEEMTKRGSGSPHLSCRALFYRISRSSHRASSVLKSQPAHNGTFALWVFVFEVQAITSFGLHTTTGR